MHRVLARVPLLRRFYYQNQIPAEQSVSGMQHDALTWERTTFENQRSASGSVSDVIPDAVTAETDRICVLCHQPVVAWQPYVIRAEEISEFVLRVGSVGSNVERFGCPHCGSSDRERHLRLFFDRLGLFEKLTGASILHIAPEAGLSALLRQCNLSRYVKGDLFPADPSIQTINVEQIDFPDETFDMVICNHVLEHVERPSVALAEIRRVLKPGCRIVCQTPYAMRLSKTFEDPLLQTEQDRLFFYAQQDHVRMFARDIEDLIRAAGFSGRIVPNKDLLSDIDGEKYGINEREPFFDFIRC
jgi:SAM-dependent methyltransferase